jgi:hypothetical protein
LQGGATYCWRVAGKTMANLSAGGPTWCFTTSGTAPTPAGPMQLLHDSTGPAVDQLASLDSISFLRDPFPVLREVDLLNRASDRNTRLIVFVRNLQLAQGEPASSVLVNLVDASNQSFDVTAETVLPVPNTDFVQVTFRLPTSLAAGRCTVGIKVHGQMSNIGAMRIRN